MDILLIMIGIIFCIAGFILLIEDQIFSPLIIGAVLIVIGICWIKYFPGQPTTTKETTLTNKYKFGSIDVTFDKAVKIEQQETKYNWIFLMDETRYFVSTIEDKP